MSIKYFEYLKGRMPHFFDGVTVLEYVPPSQCKKIYGLFNNCRYTVLNPDTNGLSAVPDNSFLVAISIDRFHNTENYLEEFGRVYRVASRFVMFSAAAAGRKPTGQLSNLTEADFYLNFDIDSMFITHMFYVDHEDSTLYFWGIKMDEV